MSTTTPDRPAADPAVRVTFARVLRSEWGKLMSLRSTWWVLGTAVVLQAGMAALLGVFARTGVTDPGRGEVALGIDATDLPVAGLQFAQLTVVVLGALAITAEYSSGQIRSTLAAVPRRTPVLWAKTLSVGLLVVLLGIVGSALSLVAGLLIAGDRIGFDLSAGETARILAGGPLYLLGIAGLSIGVGALMRHTAGAIATLMGFLLVVQVVFSAIPLKALQVVSPWLPGTAGQQIFVSDASIQLRRAADPVGVVFDPWAGYGVFAAWVVLTLAAAAVVLRRRDA